MRPALFFDRDGTLNVDLDHLADPKQLQLIGGAAEAVDRARGAGFATVVVSNQSGIARGLFDEAAVAAVNRRLSEACGGFDAVYYCPHHPDRGDGERRSECRCRKPQPGMLLRAAAELDLDLAASYLIGDSARDLVAAAAAGCRGVLVLTGNGRETRQSAVPRAHVATDVGAAVEWAIARARGEVA